MLATWRPKDTQKSRSPKQTHQETPGVQLSQTFTHTPAVQADGTTTGQPPCRPLNLPYGVISHWQSVGTAVSAQKEATDKRRSSLTQTARLQPTRDQGGDASAFKQQKLDPAQIPRCSLGPSASSIGVSLSCSICGVSWGGGAPNKHVGEADVIHVDNVM